MKQQLWLHWNRSRGSMHWPVVTLLFSLLAACGNVEQTRRANGVPDQWTVDSVPIVDIIGTSVDGSVVLSEPIGGTRLPDGGIVVADRMASAVQFFDAEGRLLRATGRMGGGPGEFELLNWFGRCAQDTVYAWDARLRRMTLLAADGELQTTYGLPRDPGTDRPPELLACSSAGVFASAAEDGTQGYRAPLTGEGSRMRGPVLVTDGRGTIAGRVPNVPLYELRPLGRVVRLAVGGDRMYVATNDSAWVSVYGLDGLHLLDIAMGLELQPPTRHAFETAVEAQVRVFRDADMREGMQARLLEVEMPEYVPPVTALFVDPHGLLWVQTSEPGAPSTRLQVHDQSGSVRAVLTVPRELTIFEVGSDYVLGAFEDSLGEPHVVLWALRRT